MRSECDPALADISFLITDKFQGRGLGTLLMGAAAIAARRNAITRFSADVLAENVPMRAILNHAAIGWNRRRQPSYMAYLRLPTQADSGSRPERRRHSALSWTR